MDSCCALNEDERGGEVAMDDASSSSTRLPLPWRSPNSGCDKSVDGRYASYAFRSGSAAPSSEAEAEAEEEREEGLCGLKAAVRSGATPAVEVGKEEDVEEAVVLTVAVVELEEKD